MNELIILSENEALRLGGIIARLSREHRERCDAAVLKHRAKGGKTVPEDLVIPRPPLTYCPEDSADDATDLGALCIAAVNELLAREKKVE